MHAHAEPNFNGAAFSATNHCLTGCVLGEVVGMVIATAFDWGNAASIALAVALAFAFGYSLTSIPRTWPSMRCKRRFSAYLSYPCSITPPPWRSGNGAAGGSSRPRTRSRTPLRLRRSSD